VVGARVRAVEASHRRGELLVGEFASAVLAGQQVNLIVELGLRAMPRGSSGADRLRGRRRGLQGHLTRGRLGDGAPRPEDVLEHRQDFVVFVWPVPDETEPGQVVVTHGVFMDNEGTVLRSGSKKVYVKLESLQQVMIVEFPASYVAHQRGT